MTLPPKPRTLVIGDSYSVSTGATPNTAGWAFQLDSLLGGSTTVDGVGGTGYVNPGPSGTFNDRLWRHLADAFDLVVLQGGSNDVRITDGVWRWSSSQIAGGVNQAIRTVLRRYPRAQLVLLGATSPYGSYGQDRLTINAILKRYAGYYSVPFVDPIAEVWFRPGDGKMYADAATGHPNNAGYQVMAQRFVADMRGI